MYPVHKEFGVLAFLIGGIALIVRRGSAVPPHPAGLARWENRLSGIVQYAMLALVIVVPLMGYAMFGSFTQSDGVPFFGIELPELLPKNDHAVALFAQAHKVLAYTLLGLVALHVAGVVKHRFPIAAAIPMCCRGCCDDPATRARGDIVLPPRLNDPSLHSR